MDNPGLRKEFTPFLVFIAKQKQWSELVANLVAKKLASQDKQETWAAIQILSASRTDYAVMCLFEALVNANGPPYETQNLIEGLKTCNNLLVIELTR